MLVCRILASKLIALTLKLLNKPNNMYKKRYSRIFPVVCFSRTDLLAWVHCLYVRAYFFRLFPLFFNTHYDLLMVKII